MEICVYHVQKVLVEVRIICLFVIVLHGFKMDFMIKKIINVYYVLKIVLLIQIKIHVSVKIHHINFKCILIQLYLHSVN